MLILLFFICQPSWEITQTPKWPQSEQTCFLIEKMYGLCNHIILVLKTLINPHLAQIFWLSSGLVGFTLPGSPPLPSFSPKFMFSGHAALHAFQSCAHIRAFALVVPSVWCFLPHICRHFAPLHYSWFCSKVTLSMIST